MERLAEVSGKSVIAGALRYALGLWDGLVRFLDDGRIEIDSNTVERSMRPVRKKALFAGGDDRDLQAQRRQSAGLAHRRAHQARQQLAQRSTN